MGETKDLQGLVVKNTGSHYEVLTDGGQSFDCKIKGNFRLRGIRTTNPVAVGDHVKISPINETTAFIVDIAPRSNYIIRRASNLSKESHIIAANIDQVFLVVTLADPVTPLTFIDRFLATAEAYNIPATLVINKIDLLAEDENSEYLEVVDYLYKSIGYRVINVSAKSNIGINTLKELLNGKITLLSGNSGVGKSTIINALIPGANLRTASISSLHHTGMHTTTFSQMLPIDTSRGGYIIDTPGVKGFGTIDFEAAEVGHYFPEIFRTSRQCRFSDCTHTGEPGCAVTDAVENQHIAASRYNSYLSILSDLNPDKYRKPF